jgi:hypothetical protein
MVLAPPGFVCATDGAASFARRQGRAPSGQQHAAHADPGPPKIPPRLTAVAGSGPPRRGASLDNATGRKNMQQLIQLRWLAVVGQLVTILVVHYGLHPLPLEDMLRCWPAGAVQRGEPAALAPHLR